MSSAYSMWLSIRSLRVLPVDLLVKERSLIHQRIGEEEGAIRDETLNLLQEKWNRTTSGRWTKRLIPIVRRWTERKHGELDFHPTQILNGYGCFEAYLYKIGKRRPARCIFVYCQEEDDMAEFSNAYPLQMQEMGRRSRKLPQSPRKDDQSRKLKQHNARCRD